MSEIVRSRSGKIASCIHGSLAVLLVGGLLAASPLAHAQAVAAAQPKTVAQIFGPENSQALLMRMEVALAKVQARRGIIPASAAKEIERTGSPAFVSLAAVDAERAKVGHPMVALINAWAKVAQGDAGEYIHYGPTTQDIYDTTQLIQMRQSAVLMIGQMRELEAAMLKLAKEHRSTPMIGRTLGRHALPLTFGAKVASWAAENRRNIERLKGWAQRSNATMISGAVGSYASMGDTAFEVEAEVARELGTGAPLPIDWKGSKDMHAEYGSLLAIASKTLGKIGQEVFLLQGDDIRELEDPNPGVGSSTMPHKINPQYSIPMVKASRVVPHQAQVLQDWMMTIYERDQISNADMLGEISKTFDGQLKSANAMMRGLKVHPENMERNLMRTHGLIMAEEAMFLLGREVGKHTAHQEVNAAARVAWDKGTSFTLEIRARPKLADAARKMDLDAALDPRKYIGQAPQAVDRTVAFIEKAREADAQQPGIR